MQHLAYLAHCNDYSDWKRNHSPDDKNDIPSLGGWIREEATAALSSGRSVWVYWPYGHQDDATKIKAQLDSLHALLEMDDLTNAKTRRKSFALARLGTRPLESSLEIVEGAYCVVYYVEPKRRTSGRPGSL